MLSQSLVWCLPSVSNCLSLFTCVTQFWHLCNGLLYLHKWNYRFPHLRYIVARNTSTADDIDIIFLTLESVSSDSAWSVLPELFCDMFFLHYATSQNGFSANEDLGLILHWLLATFTLQSRCLYIACFLVLFLNDGQKG